MSACATQVFQNVTSSVWNCIVSKAASQGIDISSPQGAITKDGFTVNWDYNNANGTLAITCTDSPWYVPCSLINSTIHQQIDTCL
jgi:hypothetical protein